MSRFHTAQPVGAPSIRFPGRRKEPSKTQRPPLVPADVVHAMRAIGWPVAPALMERRLTSPAWVMPKDIKDDGALAIGLSAEQADDGRIVMMDWAMRYQRVRDAHNELAQTALNAAGIRELRKRLAGAGWRGGPMSLGHTRMSARELDASCQVNIRSFGGMSDPIDAL